NSLRAATGAGPFILSFRPLAVGSHAAFGSHAGAPAVPHVQSSFGPGAGRIGTVARTRVAGPVTTISAASGTAASGGVSRSRNACMPSPHVHGSPAPAPCQFPAPSVSHQEKPGVQLYANQSVSGGMPLLI